MSTETILKKLFVFVGGGRTRHSQGMGGHPGGDGRPVDHLPAEVGERPRQERHAGLLRRTGMRHVEASPCVVPHPETHTGVCNKRFNWAWDGNDFVLSLGVTELRYWLQISGMALVKWSGIKLKYRPSVEEFMLPRTL